MAGKRDVSVALGLSRGRSSGGAAASAGVNFQHRVAAFLAAHMLLGEHAPRLFDWAVGTVVAELRCETAGPVDDLELTTVHGDRALLQVKRGLHASASAGSRFADALGQLGAQLADSTGDPAASKRERLVLVVDPSSSRRITDLLSGALVRLRSRPERHSTDSATVSDAHAAILRTAAAHLARGYEQVAGRSPGETEMTAALRRTHVMVLALDDDGADRLRMEVALGQLFADPADGVRAWQVLFEACARRGELRGGFDRSQLQLLVHAHRLPARPRLPEGARHLRFPELPASHLVEPEALGVTTSSIADRYRRPDSDRPPYVRRPAVDHELDAALRGRSFVLVVGDSKAGKSRTAYEALRRSRHTFRMLVPRRHADLSAIVAADFSAVLRADEKSVLWLDDLDQYLFESPAVDRRSLLLLLRRHPGMRVVATMQSGKYRNITSADKIVPAHMAGLLRAARVLRLDATLDDDEGVAAKRIFKHEKLGSVVRLGEYLVAADELVARLVWSSDTAPEGVAVARAAIDLRRAAMRRIEREQLWTLFPWYYRQLRPALPVTRSAFERGIEWALTPVASSISLLGASDESGVVLEPFEYCVAWCDRQSESRRHWQEVPAVTWEHRMGIAGSPDELLAAALAASQRGAIARPFARRALVQVAESSDRALAAMASWSLGMMAWEEEDRAACEAWMRLVYDAEESSLRAEAALFLGDVLRWRQEFEQARPLFEFAMRHGGDHVEPEATFQLGAVLFALEQPAEAEPLLRRALGDGDPDRASKAAVLLADLCDDDEKDELLEVAMGSTVTPIAVRAANALGERAFTRGDFETAASALERVLRDGDRRQMLRALSLLLVVYATLGREDDLRAACDSALTMGNVILCAHAEVTLAELIADADPEQASDLFRRAIEREAPPWSTHAAHVGGLHALRNGDRDVAETWLVQALEETIPAFRTKAAIGLLLTWKPIRSGKAEDWVRRDEETEVELSGQGRLLLADELVKHGHHALAEGFYEDAIKVGDPAIVARAAVGAAELAARREDLAAAGAWLRQAYELGQPRVSARAALALGLLEQTTERAVGWLRCAAGGDDPEVAVNARIALRRLEEE